MNGPAHSLYDPGISQASTTDSIASRLSPSGFVRRALGSPNPHVCGTGKVAARPFSLRSAPRPESFRGGE